MRPSAFALVLFLVLTFIFPIHPANAVSPSLFFGVPPSQVAEGDRVTVDIRVQSTSRSINAISGSVIFPEALVGVVSISKDGSIINLWTQEPRAQRNRVVFEGIVLNPGFQGSSGSVFHITFEAKKAGTATLSFGDGAVLANDGYGTNVLATLGSAKFTIVPGQIYALAPEVPTSNGRLAALPVITDYSPAVASESNLYVKGKGEPNALTKIVFKDVSVKSVGERLIAALQTKKKKLSDILVKNDPEGGFEYISSKNVLAGVYNATPFLVDQNSSVEKPGLGVQLLVSDSKIVRALVVLINVLGLLIPVVGLGVVIYFIPWYSWRRMRIIKKKLGLEEEKIELSGHALEREDKILDARTDGLAHPEKG